MLYSPDYQIPMHSNNTIDKTLFAWSQKKPGSHRYMDHGVWPDNKPCSDFAYPNLQMVWSDKNPIFVIINNVSIIKQYNLHREIE